MILLKNKPHYLLISTAISLLVVVLFVLVCLRRGGIWVFRVPRLRLCCCNGRKHGDGDVEIRIDRSIVPDLGQRFAYKSTSPYPPQNEEGLPEKEEGSPLRHQDREEEEETTLLGRLWE
ncbi:unnamed protein product [Amoebophrya sp. A25]|nr:unnamed protein product [Amoebophrya sp. A25]|eukprot:GSA25T00001337001.1